MDRKKPGKRKNPVKRPQRKTEKCAFCGSDFNGLPFICKYCGESFCVAHRLPEDHECKVLAEHKRKINEGEIASFSTSYNTDWDGMAYKRQQVSPPRVFSHEYVPKNRGFFYELAARFSAKEVGDILIAWITLSFAFSFLLDPAVNTRFPAVFAASLIVLLFAFIMHEMMHKFTAQKLRYQAEFRIWPLGIILALVTAILIGILFAMPGATYFEPDPNEPYMDPKGFIRRYGQISLAGPIINLVFGFIFLALFFLVISILPYISAGGFGSFALLITGLGSFINFYLCAFNLIPFGMLDGAKVLRWNKVYWAVPFLISAAVSALMFLGYIPVLAAV
ncbi:hypothetical protein M1293_02440 [Candidatus Parvarchaeota archaeon]|nr:hypothetical protein [Candidatus Parvarchaeota archaeon]